MSRYVERDEEWRRALKPPGFAEEAWMQAGPKNPEEAAVFVAEAERVGDEHLEQHKAEVARWRSCVSLALEILDARHTGRGAMRSVEFTCEVAHLFIDAARAALVEVSNG